MNGEKRKLGLLLVACCLQLIARSQGAISPAASTSHTPGITAALPARSAGSPPETITPAYWQQEVHYDITVTLNDREHSLNGSETIRYSNHSPDTLTSLWFHIWPNAYKDKNTALYKQLAILEERRDKLNKTTENGYIDHLAFTVNGIKASTEPHPEYSDIIHILLPDKLPPGGQITIATPFFVKIPAYFSRLGHEGQSYMITQWYPKPAVYDHNGWHPIPYLDQGEFYSEFGSFDVHITLPASYVVGAGATLRSREELEKYRQIGKANLTRITQAAPPNTTGPARADRSVSFIHYQAMDPAAMKTLDYQSENVHDFAWFADKSLVINYDTLQLPSGKIIDVFSYYHPRGNKEWRHSISFIKDAVTRYSGWIGEYDYPMVSALEGPGNISSGGMEYPMITLITSPGAGKSELDGVIAHEIGHNWFYGMLGSNEREHPWMDEGINTYYEFRYEAEKYRVNDVLGAMLPMEMKLLPADEFLDNVYRILNRLGTSEPIETPAADFPSEFDYGIVIYARTAVWMNILEHTLGADNFKRGMSAYFSDWKFRHPYPADFKASLERATHSNLDKVFTLLSRTGSL